MKKRFVIFVFALAVMLSLSTGLNAQVGHVFKVSVPFEFFVAGKTMPAGTYTVSRVSADSLGPLLLSSYESKASVVVLPTAFDSNSGGAVSLVFEQVGDQRFLNRVGTPNGAYNIVTKHSNAVVAKKRHSDGSVAGAP
jgi:hypothetical protein